MTVAVILTVSELKKRERERGGGEGKMHRIKKMRQRNEYLFGQ